MAKYPRSIRKQFQLQRDGSTWQVWGFSRGVWKILTETDSRKNSKWFIKVQTEYHKLYLNYQKGARI